MVTELSQGEKGALAREIAIDRHGYRNWSYGVRAFSDGWDAALVWAETQREDQRLDDWQRGYEAGLNGE